MHAATVKIEAPNAELYSFKAKLILPDETHTPLTLEQTLWRVTILSLSLSLSLALFLFTHIRVVHFETPIGYMGW